MEDIITVISNVGFPIAACVFLYLENKQTREAHEKESTKMTEAINNNTLALTKLIERLHYEDK